MKTVVIHTFGNISVPKIIHNSTTKFLISWYEGDEEKDNERLLIFNKKERRGLILDKFEINKLQRILIRREEIHKQISREV